MARRMTAAQKAAELQRHLKERNYDPIDEILRIAKGHNTKSDIRLKIAMDLLPYVYAKKKAVEMTAPPQPVTFNFDLQGKAPSGNEVPNESAEADSSVSGNAGA